MYYTCSCITHVHVDHMFMCFALWFVWCEAMHGVMTFDLTGGCGQMLINVCRHVDDVGNTRSW